MKIKTQTHTHTYSRIFEYLALIWPINSGKRLQKQLHSIGLILIKFYKLCTAQSYLGWFCLVVWSHSISSSFVNLVDAIFRMSSRILWSTAAAWKCCFRMIAGNMGFLLPDSLEPKAFTNYAAANTIFNGQNQILRPPKWNHKFICNTLPVICSEIWGSLWQTFFNLSLSLLLPSQSDENKFQKRTLNYKPSGN